MLQRKQVLFLGNGINRIANDYSWEDLMHDLLAFARLEGALTTEDKPFPLLYEEIYLRWAHNSKQPELALKKTIRNLLQKIRSNHLHEQAMQLPVDEILTTNYDYNLESAIPGGLQAADYIRPIKGSKYSLMRRRQAGDKVVWHIHGENRAPGSILLGYEQYAGYLQNIRNYVISGIRYKNLELTPLNQRIRKQETEIKCWIDHFFFSDMYIVGLSMDFVEMHLWWILDFRARLMLDGQDHITNTIQFIFPEQLAPFVKPKIDLLCACNVDCLAFPVVDDNWAEMYVQTLNYIGHRVAATKTEK